MRSSPRRIASFLFCSGACALVYQTTWLRELRLIFGGSTSASSAVLAVFMGGLGIGGFVFGKRADRIKNPFALYGNLELVVAALAAVTPAFILIARAFYLALGGEAALGSVGATIVRLLLTALVLGPSTVAMGGTMPAAARAIERLHRDDHRKNVGLIYGANTMGAVVGTIAASFLLLEVFGNRMTLWLACLVNALVGMVARAASRNPSFEPTPETPKAETTAEPPGVLRWFPPFAAAIAGFAFMLMELVWYRMLAPLLGGTSYTFGLILAVALAGIGLGGALYSRTTRGGTLAIFALTCALEALAIAIPFALGDRLAVLTYLLTPLSHSSFGGSLLVWGLITTIVVVPAAIVSGYQFPAIIGLYGRGEKNVGADVGRAYVSNTLGSIIGSIAGGFGFLPLFTAPGCWRFVVALLGVGALVAVALDSRNRGRSALRSSIPAVGIAAVSAGIFFAEGPTAVWRHSGIGAGRAGDFSSSISKTDVLTFVKQNRASNAWEADGLESTVALSSLNGYSFIVNGKSDGHIYADRSTQVLSGLIGALIHGHPTRSLVIGLGTGSTAGWMAAIPEMERVDVFELEPAILRVARDCAPANHDVLGNSKVHVTIGDAREGLLVGRETSYDIIFSEPSNPYRAGISSLYTTEFYRAAAERLSAEGVFLQWVQTYDVDPVALATVMVTVREVFPVVSVWQTEAGDLLIIGQRTAKPLDVEALRARLREEPFASAMRTTWQTTSVEGVLNHFVGSSALVDRIAESALGYVNHDDDNLLEFAFARHVGSKTALHKDLLELSLRLGTMQPSLTGNLDDRLLLEERIVGEFPMLSDDPRLDPDAKKFVAAIRTLEREDFRNGLALWSRLEREPRSFGETMLVARAMAEVGDSRFHGIAPALPPTDRELLLATWSLRNQDTRAALTSLERGFTMARGDPWVSQSILERSLQIAGETARRLPPTDITTLVHVLLEPFSVERARALRLLAALDLSLHATDKRICLDVVNRGGDTMRDRRFLEAKVRCLRGTGDARAEEGIRELDELRALAPVFGRSLLPAPSAGAAPPPAGSPTGSL